MLGFNPVRPIDRWSYNTSIPFLDLDDGYAASAPNRIRIASQARIIGLKAAFSNRAAYPYNVSNAGSTPK